MTNKNPSSGSSTSPVTSTPALTPFQAHMEKILTLCPTFHTSAIYTGMDQSISQCFSNLCSKHASDKHKVRQHYLVRDYLTGSKTLEETLAKPSALTAGEAYHIAQHYTINCLGHEDYLIIAEKVTELQIFMNKNSNF